MVEIVEAHTYKDEAPGGATCPSRIFCETSDGKLIDVFVKGSGEHCAPSGLANEFVAWRLAQRLGIPAAKCVLVSVSIEFIDHLGSIIDREAAARRIRQSVKPLFGSIDVGPGYRLCSAAVVFDDRLAAQAGKLWAFDEIILNPDRHLNKPNCMTNGREIIAIDHEKALNVIGLGSLLPAPWEDGWLPNKNHIFFKNANASLHSITGLQTAIEAISLNDLNEMCQPPSANWALDQAHEGVLEYLTLLKANATATFNNLRRAIL
jgi:hypothetical protein